MAVIFESQEPCGTFSEKVREKSVVKGRRRKQKGREKEKNLSNIQVGKTVKRQLKVIYMKYFPSNLDDFFASCLLFSFFMSSMCHFFSSSLCLQPDGSMSYEERVKTLSILFTIVYTALDTLPRI